MSKVLFISDLHLSEDRRDITDCFLSFLNNTVRNQCDTLYILGDFFEVWVGDDNLSSLNLEIAAALKSISDSGTNVFFIHGNRDFFVGEHYALRCGMTILPEPDVITINNQPISILHGDSLCTDDEGYMKFRRFIRHPIVKTILLSLPLFTRKWIGKKMRESSKQSQQHKNMAIMDVNEQAVSEVFESTNTSMMIHGHTHKPFIHEATGQYLSLGRTRIVLGDWYTQGSYLSFTDGQPTLHSMKL